MKFKLNGWEYEANKTLTSNWGWPEGFKGQRIRIKKKDFLQMMKEEINLNNNGHIAFLAKLNGIEF